MKKGRVIILIIRIFFSLLWILHQSQILWNHSNVHSEKSDDRTKREDNFHDLGYPWSRIVSMWGDSCNIQNIESRQKHLHDHIWSIWYASIQTRENATFRGQIMWFFARSRSSQDRENQRSYAWLSRSWILSLRSYTGMWLPWSMRTSKVYS